MDSVLVLDNVTKKFDDLTVVDGVSLTLKQGTIACLLGPSGSGKTTLLRSIAGFEPISGGTVKLHGTEVSSAGSNLPPEKRNLGMVFQDYGLFPHLTVE
jgi:iron(III) transport system ATP-binding protein